MRVLEVIDDIETYPEKFVAPMQLARYFHVPRSTLYYHIRIGALVVVRRGGVLRVPIDEARRYCRPSRLLVS